MVKLQVNITGRVQGVNFRVSTKQKAEKLGVVGTVENLPDGSVKVVAEGEKQALEKLLEWCKQGPKLAEVASCNYEWQEASQEFSEFKVIRSGGFIKDQLQAFKNFGRSINKPDSNSDSN